MGQTFQRILILGIAVFAASSGLSENRNTLGLGATTVHAAQWGYDSQNKRIWVKTSTGEIKAYGVDKVFTPNCRKYASKLAPGPPPIKAAIIVAANYGCSVLAGKLKALAYKGSSGLWASLTLTLNPTLQYGRF